MDSPKKIGIIAGNGAYPATVAAAARGSGVQEVVVAAFAGETESAWLEKVDYHEWLRVGQLGRLIKFLRAHEVSECIMAGQIAPRNLFDMRPDMRLVKMLARIPERNAESLFTGIADELARDGITLLPATTFLEDHLPAPGHVCGPSLKKRQGDDVRFGMDMAKKISAMDIGQTIVVRHGTVLAVEAFEGTNETIRRGGPIGKGQAMVIKVSKPNQDFRFDVPVVGPDTITIAVESRIQAIAVEAGRTLILQKSEVEALCKKNRISLYAAEADLTTACR